jgi:hypothetical protein
MSRNPVTWAAGIAGVLAALVSVGVLNADTEANVNGIVQALVGASAFLIPLIAGFLARSKVTPVASPRDTNRRA